MFWTCPHCDESGIPLQFQTGHLRHCPETPANKKKPPIAKVEPAPNCLYCGAPMRSRGVYCSWSCEKYHNE